MLDLSKSARVRVLVLGLLLVKLALFLLFYHPVLVLSSQPSVAPQGPAQPLVSQPQAPGMRTPAEGGRGTAAVPAAGAFQGGHPSESPWPAVKQLLGALERQRIALADKEARLRREEEQLETLKGSLREQVEELTTLRARVSEVLRKKWELEDEELKRLARVYEATTPEQSGVLLGKLDAKLAAQILSRMNGPRAGKVLSSMEPTKAARISEQLLKKE